MGAETNAKNRVHRLLPKTLHKESMTGGFQNGRPDNYYDGEESDLWTEWKTGELYSEPSGLVVQFEATTLQQKWNERRYNNGGNAHVIVALANGEFALAANPATWRRIRTNTAKKRHVFRAPVIDEFTAKEVAEWIESFCSGE